MPRAPVSFLVLVLAMSGCRGIPNRVQPEEYNVYSAWLGKRPAKHPPPGNLYISFRTMIYNATQECGKQLRPLLKSDAGLADQLSALGEAQYPLDLYSTPPKLKVPMPFKPLGDYPSQEPNRPYRLITFSRVAFNTAGTVALFAVSGSCGGLCGGGGALIARRDNAGVWAFEDTGCVWVY